MRRIRISAALLSLLFLAGCAGGESGRKLQVDFANMPDQLTIYTDAAFQDEYGQVDQAALEAWEAYMSDTYKTTVSVQNNRNMWDTHLYKMDISNTNGLVHLYPGEISQCLMDDSILPLEEYLADNEVWKALPESFRNRFVKDGHLWAIPMRTQTNLEVLSINTQWLNNAKQETPQTMEELLAVGAAFREKDVNGDGQKNDYLFGLPYMLSRDFFAGYGLYYTSKSMALAYNPEKHIFEDAALQEPMSELMQKVKKIHADGLVDSDALLGTADIQQKNLSGSYGVVQGNPALGKYQVSFNAKRAEGLTEEELLAQYDSITAGYDALDPLSGEHPLTYSEDGECYVLSKGTKDPKAVVNAFVEILFGSVYSYSEMSLGVPDNYRIDNDVISLQYSDDETKKMPASPNLVDALDLIGSGNYLVVKPEENTELARKLQKDRKQYIAEYIDRNTKNGKLVKLSPFLLAENLKSGYGSINTSFCNLMTGIINPKNSIESLIEIYRNTATVQTNYQDRLILYNKVNGLSAPQ